LHLLTAAVLAALLPLGPGTAADAGLRPRLKVYVGYMDTHTRPSSPRQPRIWPYRNKHRFVGTPCRHYGTSPDCWDASAIRLDNPGDRPLRRVHVTVVIGDHVYHLWGRRRIGAHSRLVLTETGAHHNSQNFDGSDEAPNDYNGGREASCKDSGAIPRVIVRIGHRRPRIYRDKRQVLNAGGVDDGHCRDGHFVPGRRDESHRWVRVRGHLRRF
jgi:hypothetical protein